MTEKSNWVEYVLEDDVQKLPKRSSDQEQKEHCTPDERGYIILLIVSMEET